MAVSRSSPPIDLVGICEAIWKIEADLDLFRQEVAGVHYWRLVRWEIGRALAQKTDHAAGSPGSSPKSLAYRLNHEVRALRRSLEFADWTAAGPVDTIVVPFPRKHLRNGAMVDVHSEGVLNDPAFGRILALERTDADAHVPSTPAVFVTDRDRGRPEAVARALVRFPALLGPLAPVREALQTAIRREMGMDLPISLESLALRVALFREYRAVSRRMLRATGARRFISAWTDQVMVAAARDLGMQTVEIQHAAFSKYSLQYHFPYRGPIPHAPDQLLTFGQYWIDSVDLPAQTQAVVVGSANIAAQRVESQDRRLRRVIVLSQGPTHWPLLDCILDAAALAPDWDFVFRPHPREDITRYRAHIAECGGMPSNLRLSEVHEDVYRLIASAEVQIGISSTTLFEGMALGCRTIVFEGPGCEAMDGVVLAKDAVVAGTANEIVAHLATAPKPQKVEAYYANPRSFSGALANN